VPACSGQAFGGRIDFHSLRVTYDTMVFEMGASTKEAQHLMRHQDPRLTLHTYARTRMESSPKPLKLTALTVADAARVLSSTSGREITEDQVQMGAEHSESLKAGSSSQKNI